MILSDREIAAALDLGHIIIRPRPPSELWTSTAIDLTLNGALLRWRGPERKASGAPFEPKKIYPAGDGFNIKDLTKDPEFAQTIPIPTDHGHPLYPGEFVLGYTRESVYLPNKSRIAARVEGKSSLARLGVGVHVTAPTIHAGFGFNEKSPDEPGLPVQLEIFNLGDFIVYLASGMPICQLILEEVRETPNKGYQGRFSTQEPFQARD